MISKPVINLLSIVLIAFAFGCTNKKNDQSNKFDGHFFEGQFETCCLKKTSIRILENRDSVFSIYCYAHSPSFLTNEAIDNMVSLFIYEVSNSIHYPFGLEMTYINEGFENEQIFYDISKSQVADIISDFSSHPKYHLNVQHTIRTFTMDELIACHSMISSLNNLLGNEKFPFESDYWEILEDYSKTERRPHPFNLVTLLGRTDTAWFRPHIFEFYGE